MKTYIPLYIANIINVTSRFSFGTILLIVPSRIYPSIHIAEISQTHSFTCESTTTSKWTFNDGNLPPNVKKFNRTTITIFEITPTNRGYYECQGTTESIQYFYAKALLKVVGKLF